jgi:hypothetical protein
MVINHSSSKYRGTQLLTALIACALPQYSSLGAGLWWLFIAIGVVMILIYRQPEICGRKGLMGAIIALQSANFIGGVSFYFLENYRSEITIAVGAFCLIYPLRKFVLLSQEINNERKLRESLEG